MIQALSGMLSPKVPLTPAVQRGLMQFQSPDLKRAENSDTMFTKGSLRAAYRAAGAVLAAVSEYAHRKMQVNLSHAWFAGDAHRVEEPTEARADRARAARALCLGGVLRPGRASWCVCI